MNIKTKFSINDRVFTISQETTTDWKICGACGGTGKIFGLDTHPYTCPECDGKKGRNIYTGQEWKPTTPLTIGQIRAEISNIVSDGKFSNMGHYEDGATKQEVSYMVYEWGIGSGRLLGEKDVFTNLKEALKECKIRNKLQNINQE